MTVPILPTSHEPFVRTTSVPIVMLFCVIVSLGWLWLAPFVDAKVGFFFDIYKTLNKHFTQIDHLTWNERFGG